MNTTQHLLDRCKLLAGSYERSHLDRRACSHCGLPLTDPASWERGVGPICAKNSTTLFAREMKFQGSFALANLFSVKPENLPEQIREFWKTEILPTAILVLKDACAATSALQTHGVDLRGLAKVVAWVLSHRIPRDTKILLVGFVRHLGFVGYAAVLGGEASTGPATIKFNEATGVVELRGSKCKAGMKNLREAIPSVLFPTKASPVFSGPAASAKAFVEIAVEFWPMVSGNVQEILEKAQQWVDAHPVVLPEIIGPKLVVPTAKITKVPGNLFQVSLDWTRECYGVVAQIKEIVPKAKRRYDSLTQKWEIDNVYLDDITQTIKKFAPKHTIIES
jgi:hypothetical protein